MNAKHVAVATLAASLLLGSSLVRAEDEHHPESPPAQQATPSAPPSAGQRPPIPGPGMGMPGVAMPGQGQPPMGPMGQQGMGPMAQPPMGQGPMPMAAMMDRCLDTMGMSNAGEFAEAFPGTGMMGRVEGRIAFLRAELKIDESQRAAWDEFAQALRDNAKTLGDTHATVTKRQAPANAPPTLAARLAAQEDWFAARVTGIRRLRQGLERLYAVLSDTQKKTADELLAPHLGMGGGGGPAMGMMSMGGGMSVPGMPQGGGSR